MGEEMPIPCKFFLSFSFFFIHAILLTASNSVLRVIRPKNAVTP